MNNKFYLSHESFGGGVWENNFYLNFELQIACKIMVETG